MVCKVLTLAPDSDKDLCTVDLRRADSINSSVTFFFFAKVMLLLLVYSFTQYKGFSVKLLKKEVWLVSQKVSSGVRMTGDWCRFLQNDLGQVV